MYPKRIYKAPDLWDSSKKEDLIAYINAFLDDKQIAGSVVPTFGGSIERIYSIGTPREKTESAINEAIKSFREQSNLPI